MRRLVVEACQAQMAKIQLKMQYYEELDAALNREQSVMQVSNSCLLVSNPVAECTCLPGHQLGKM